MHSQGYLLLLSLLIPFIDAERGTLSGSSTANCNQAPTQVSAVHLPVTTLITTTKVKRSEATLLPVSNVPASNSSDAERLVKRAGALRFSNCGASPGSSWEKGGFKTQESVLRTAFVNALTMAEKAADVTAGSKGFQHYFGGDLTDVQLTSFKNMMRAIASTEIHFTVEFECKEIPQCTALGAKGKSAMVTLATAGDVTTPKTIQVCSSFWTSPSTVYLLPRDSDGRRQPTASPPFRDRDTWCERVTRNGDEKLSGREAQWYATAGHTVLHELTHLDALAKAAGLSPDGDNRHGTLDAQNDEGITGDQCELTGARNYLQKYKDHFLPKMTSPDYNAESYAAAATEIYFMKLCDFSQIRPET